MTDMAPLPLPLPLLPSADPGGQNSGSPGQFNGSVGLDVSALLVGDTGVSNTWSAATLPADLAKQLDLITVTLKVGFRVAGRVQGGVQGRVHGGDQVGFRVGGRVQGRGQLGIRVAFRVGFRVGIRVAH